MYSPFSFRAFVPALTLTLAAVLGTSAQADIVVSLEAAGVQSSQVSGVTTMDFNAPTYSVGSYTTLTTSIGTYTASGRGLAIVAPTGGNASYGGATTTGSPSAAQSQYMAIGAESGQLDATLNLGQERSYFGMYWTAGDNKNTLEFFKGTQIIATYNTASVISFIGKNRSYYGNPNNGRDSSEPFAYLNFFGQNGTTFDKVVFLNADTGSGFESDNHSVRTEQVTTTTGTTITSIAAVPEPPVIILAGVAGIAGVGGLLVSRFRGRSTIAAASEAL